MNPVPTYSAWQPVKVVNEESAYAGRAGVYLRDEAGGLVVKLDADQEHPEAVLNFAAAEVQPLA